MPSEPSAELRGYLPSLDGWRAVAITIVLVFHSRDALIRAFGAPMASIAPHMLLWGPFGVDLFFAISGLLITSRLLAEEDVSGRISLSGFYRRRAYRILPASLMYLAAILVLGGTGLIAFRMDSWRAALLFFVNFQAEPLWYVGHFWSLAVEEHFYAFWPALLLFVRRKQRLPIAIGLCLSVALWRALQFKFVTLGATYFTHQGRTDFQLDGILWGAALALAFHHLGSRPGVRRLLTIPTGTLLFLLILASLFAPGGWKLYQGLLLFRRIATPVVLLITILNCRGLVAAILENSWLRKLGRLSYSLYLWQQLFLVWGIQSAAYVAWPQRFPFNLVCVFACALLSYHLLERPFIRLSRRAAKSKQLTPPAETLIEASA